MNLYLYITVLSKNLTPVPSYETFPYGFNLTKFYFCVHVRYKNTLLQPANKFLYAISKIAFRSRPGCKAIRHRR